MQMILCLPGVLLLSAAAACGQSAHSGRQIPVELWHTGDDAYSQRVVVAMENKFEQARDFVTSTGRKPGTLIVQIPRNVDWERVGSRIKILYTVQISWTDHKKSATRKGSCWEDEADACAAQILKAAREVAGRTP